MAQSDTCAGADASLPEEFLEEIRKCIREQRKKDPQNQNRCAWEIRGPKDRDGKPIPKATRTNLDDHDCCMLEDLGGDFCEDECCLSDALAKQGTGPKKKVPYDDNDPNAKPRKPL
jgi:hypothetical protein